MNKLSKILNKVSVVCFAILLSGCYWEKDRDATATLDENQGIDRAVKWNTYANAPFRIRFKDSDEGSFFFEGDPREVEFRFSDEGSGVYRALVEGEDHPRSIVVRKIDDDTCMVRFAEGRAWVVYQQD